MQMTSYAKAGFNSILPPAGAAVVTFGLLLMMYSLIYIDVVPERDPLSAINIPDFIQEEPEAIVDIRPSPEKIDEPVLRPTIPTYSESGTAVPIVKEPIAILPFGHPEIGVNNSTSLFATVQVQPIYSQIAVQRGLEGWVVLGFDVTKFGTTENIEVLDSEPGTFFDRTAIRALEHWKYMPKKENGIAVAVRNMQTSFIFEIEEPPPPACETSSCEQ